MANLSLSGYNLIKLLEGFRLTSYHLKGEAHWTVGLGHYGPDVIPNKTYTEAEVNAFFNKDKQRFEADVNKVWTSDMPKGAFDALFSLAYNHGNVSRTAVGKAAKAGEWKNREKFTKLWLSSYTCKGLLTGRRRKEIAYFYSTDVSNIPMSSSTPSANTPTYSLNNNNNTSALSYSEATQNNTLAMSDSQSTAFDIDDGETRTRIYKASDPTLLVDELSIPINEGTIRKDDNNSTT